MGTQIEEWKIVAECNGRYYVSNYGRVKSFMYFREKFLNGGIVGRGYRKVILVDKLNKPKQFYVHRLVALAFIPNPENKSSVNHKDGNKLNNNVDNLEWMTQQENVQHAWDTGLNESHRLSISKPVIDVATGKKYQSLKLACDEICENYQMHKQRIIKRLKVQRFFYINNNGNG
jgi:hypothetical protein